MRAWTSQLASFGAVGAVAFVIDFAVFNLLRTTVFDGNPIGAKVASVAVATIVAWIGNRYLTFRKTRGTAVAREAALFALMNVIGLLIATACLYVSHYVLGFTSVLADNIAGNGVGLVLGTTFRFFAYRLLVFRATGAIPVTPAETDPTVTGSREAHRTSAEPVGARA